MIEGDVKPKRNWPLVVLLGFPFVAVIALTLHFAFYAFGYRYTSGRVPIASIIGIVVGTQLLFAFQELLSRPSKRIVYASLACWGLLALAFVARLADLLPRDL
jgi:hypothetical protein